LGTPGADQKFYEQPADRPSDKSIILNKFQKIETKAQKKNRQKTASARANSIQLGGR